MASDLNGELYEDSPITERPRLSWPDGARVAFFAGLAMVPDRSNYGAQVGAWRVIEVLDRHGIRASAMVTSEFVERHPRIVEAGRIREC